MSETTIKLFKYYFKLTKGQWDEKFGVMILVSPNRQPSKQKCGHKSAIRARIKIAYWWLKE